MESEVSRKLKDYEEKINGTRWCASCQKHKPIFGKYRHVTKNWKCEDCVARIRLAIQARQKELKS